MAISLPLTVSSISMFDQVSPLVLKEGSILCVGLGLVDLLTIVWGSRGLPPLLLCKSFLFVFILHSEFVTNSQRFPVCTGSRYRLSLLLNVKLLFQPYQKKTICYTTEKQPTQTTLIIELSGLEFQ